MLALFPGPASSQMFHVHDACLLAFHNSSPTSRILFLKATKMNIYWSTISGKILRRRLYYSCK